MGLIERNIDGNIGEIILNRIDKRNALNSEMIGEMKNALIEFSINENIKIISFRSSGKDFSVGADINELYSMNEKSAYAFRQLMRDLVYEIDRCKKITSFFLTGFSLGGGFEISQWADLRIATTDSKIGQPEINIGVNAGAGGNSKLVEIVGYSNAIYLSLSGKMLSAEEGKMLGIVQNVVSGLEEYMQILRNISLKPEELVKGIKGSMKTYLREGIDRSFDVEEQVFIHNVPFKESKELMEKFLKKK